MTTQRFKILDCTIRDGGYINRWDFSKELVQEMYQASAEAGTDIFEIGFLSEDPKLPLWRRCPSEAVMEIRSDHKIPAISAMLEANTVGMALDSPRQTGIDILRIALNRDKLDESLKKMSAYRKQGYKVFVQLMGITGYSDMQLLRAVELLTESGWVDVISIGDSYGSLLPKRTEHIISLIVSNTSLEVGLHAHNNMLLGMSNVLAALEAGASYIDASMYGMGRGGGNVPLELVLSYFARMFPERYDARPVLEFVDRRMVQMKRDMDWGYSVGSLLSGVYECHPYYTSKLIETREFTVAQILKAVQIISNRHVIGFSKDVLSDVINSGEFLSGEEREQNLHSFIQQNRHSAVYARRHAGKEFLILGNGPSLVQQSEKIKAFIAEHDPIVMGANNLAGLFTPHYHAFNNQRRFEQFSSTVASQSIELLGPGIHSSSESLPCERIVCYNSAQAPLKIIDDVITSNCSSISVLLGAIALVMGAGTICFAGLDGYLDGKTMFYREDENVEQAYLTEKHNTNERYLSELIQLAKEKYDVSVKSLTKTSYRSLNGGGEFF